MSEIKLERLDDNRLLIPQSGGMKVPGIIYANEKLRELLKSDESTKQVINVAHLPGIVNYSRRAKGGRSIFLAYRRI